MLIFPPHDAEGTQQYLAARPSACYMVPTACCIPLGTTVILLFAIPSLLQFYFLLRLARNAWSL